MRGSIPAGESSHELRRARELAQTLAWLRLCAIAGQAITVAVVTYGLDLPIAAGPLAAGISVLAVFELFAVWRLLRSTPVTPFEAVLHIAVDVGVLACLLYWSGGVLNPFVPLLAIPIALAAAALPLRHVAIVAVLVGLEYALLARWHVDLPPLHAHGRFNLHVLGATVDFAVIAGMLAFFVSRLARALREREAEIAHERERALRDGGFLAIATQAAATAHDLNAPLSTIRTLLAELRRERAADAALAGDLDLLSGQAQRCKDILHALVEVGRRQLAGTPTATTLGAFVTDCENQFRLLRPEVLLRASVFGADGAHAVGVAPDLRHALLNLLSNAADASLAAGRADIDLGVRIDHGVVEFAIRDHGAGLAPGTGSVAFRSSKRDGLGLGLTLAHATAERLGGSLVAQSLREGGLLQRLRIPLAPTDNAAP